jgi:hypothetical protein
MINVTNYSDSIPENSSDYHRDAKIQLTDPWRENHFFPSGDYLIDGTPSGHLLVTDKMISGVIDTTVTPLYFSHEFKFDVASKVPANAIKLRTFNADASVNILDPNTYAIEMAEGLLSPSGEVPRYDSSLQWLENFRGEGTVDLDRPLIQPSGEVYRARALFSSSIVEPGVSVEATYPAYVFDQVVDHIEFINPVPIYQEGYDWNRSHQFITTMPNKRLGTADEIFLTHRPDKRISVEAPIGDEASVWRPRIHIGSFQKVDSDLIPTGTYTYKVDPRTGGTRFDQSETLDFVDDRPPGGTKVPTLKVRQEVANVINSNTIQLAHTPLAIEVSGILLPETPDGIKNGGYPWYKPLELNDAGNSDRSFDNGTPSGITIYEGNRAINNDEIADWDSRNGYVRLRSTLNRHRGPVVASYRYIPSHIEINSLDLNPRINEEIWNSGTIRVVITPEDSVEKPIVHNTSHGRSQIAWHYVQD